MANNRLWIPALAALALLLSACGDSQEEPDNEASEAPASQNDAANTPATAEGADDDVPAAMENADDMPNPEAIENEVEARQVAEELERAEALDAEGQPSAASAGDEPVDVDATEETLAADPEEVLESGGIPGETSRSDVDAMIEENERRFEEAQQRLEAQFEEIEQEDPVLEPMESEPLPPSWETQSIENDPRLEDDLEATDVQALIEENERRFEEAQKRLEAQFDEIEQERSTPQPERTPGASEENPDTSPEEGDAER